MPLGKLKQVQENRQVKAIREKENFSFNAHLTLKISKYTWAQFPLQLMFPINGPKH